MVRWIRLAAMGALLASLVAIGVGIGLFLVANSGWIDIRVPEWLQGIFGNPSLEMWVPGLIAGWLLAFAVTALMLVWSLFYVWRRRQYESLVRTLENQLTTLRNLPFTAPAPLEDLPEEPNQDIAHRLSEPVLPPSAQSQPRLGAGTDPARGPTS